VLIRRLGRKHYEEFGEEIEAKIDFNHLFTKKAPLQ
jgi:hypothetical protein